LEGKQGGKKTMRHKDVVRIGCGAGFAGDRPAAALRLLQKVPDMHYLVLECLAERTLAVRYQTMVAGGKGFDPRISEWMRLLLPTAVRKGVCLITNMGAGRSYESGCGVGDVYHCSSCI
jgi:hypothetical protein